MTTAPTDRPPVPIRPALRGPATLARQAVLDTDVAATLGKSVAFDGIGQWLDALEEQARALSAASRLAATDAEQATYEQQLDLVRQDRAVVVAARAALATTLRP